MSELHKIVFVGLDNAGKTSILRMLEGTYSGMDQIKPTLGTERTDFEIMGFQIKNWDLGGQERYRKEHLQRYKDVLFATDFLIFVLDIQRETRFEEAVIYFEDILLALKRLKIKCPVLLCLHKADPDILEKEDLQKNLDAATALFNDSAKIQDLKIKIFNTSIFDRKSLIEMFSYSISELIQLTLLNRVLNEFRQESDKYGVLGSVLFDQHLFVVGSSFPNPTIKNACFNTLNALTDITRDFKSVYDANRPIELNLPVIGGSIYKFSFMRIPKLPDTYYHLIMGAPSLKVTESIALFQDNFVAKINNTIYSQIQTSD